MVNLVVVTIGNKHVSYWFKNLNEKNVKLSCDIENSKEYNYDHNVQQIEG